MPYKSEAQRRFFHSDGARKVGITPAMVEEYDEASRGRVLPDKAEKTASAVAWRFGKIAAGVMNIANKMPSAPPKPTRPPNANTQRSSPTANQPEISKPKSIETFDANMSTMASEGADSRLRRGEELTRPT